VKAFPFRILERSPLPPYRREPVRPTAIHTAGEVTELLGDAEYSAALVMATEVPQPLERCRISGQQALLGGDTGDCVVEMPHAVNDLAAFYGYWENRDDMPTVRCPTLILDFGKLMNAYVSFEVEGNAGAVTALRAPWAAPYRCSAISR
jgi:hypothetical protein